MNGVTYVETLNRNWRSMLTWGGGITLLGGLTVAILPDVDALQQIASLMESLPPAFIQMFGGGDLEFMATAEGYLSVQFFSWMPLVLGVYAVLSGLNITANEEDEGILDIVLSLPLARWRVIIERFLAYTTLVALMLVLVFLGLAAGSALTPAIDIDLGTLAASTFNMFPVTIFLMAFTVAAGTVFRQRSHAAIASAVFVLFGYFVDTVGRSASGSILDDLRVIAYYNYYDSAGVIQSGIVLSDVLVFLVCTVVFVVIGLWTFERRDIGL